MSGYRKKIVSILAIVVISSAALMVISAKSSSNQQKTEKPKLNDNLLFANDPNFPMTANSNLGGSEIFFKMILSVFFVVALGIAAIYISKKFMPHKSLPGKEMRIIESVPLGPQKAIHLLKIGNKRFLIGSTADNVTKLADLIDEFPQSEDALVNFSEQEVNIKEVK
jgi:flagellar biosynthetic protein FliO